jgi:hypothetical protein
MTDNLIYRKQTNEGSDLYKKGVAIWKNLYRVKVPQKDLYTDEEIKYFGVPSVRDASIDRTMGESYTDVIISINAMVEYFRKGVIIKVVNHSDTKEIYEIIKDYLIAWNTHLFQDINSSTPPIEDLEALDRLAGVVYEHAVSHFKSTDIRNKLLGYDVSKSGLIGREAFNKTDDSYITKAPEKHESISYLLGRQALQKQATNDNRPNYFDRFN